jgi:hypothetical protein
MVHINSVPGLRTDLKLGSDCTVDREFFGRIPDPHEVLNKRTVDRESRTDRTQWGEFESGHCVFLIICD